MNFGMRLPGPFRVGVSGSGRVNAGVTAGPVSASTNLGGHAQPGDLFAPITLDQALASLAADGWRVKARGDGWVLVGQRMVRVRVEQVPGGVVGRRETNPWKVVIWLAVAMLLMLWCAGTMR